MNKYKCKKGKKQYNYCKKYDALYCSDCPHGILEENKNKKDYTLIEEKKEVIEILENVKSTYGDLDSLDELETDFILDIKEYKALLICLDLLKKQKKKIKKLQKKIQEKDMEMDLALTGKQAEIEDNMREIIDEYYIPIEKYRQLEESCVSKEAIKLILNKYGKKPINEAVNFYKELQELLGE